MGEQVLNTIGQKGNGTGEKQGMHQYQQPAAVHFTLSRRSLIKYNTRSGAQSFSNLISPSSRIPRYMQINSIEIGVLCLKFLGI
jgi:hypothetical protein